MSEKTDLTLVWAIENLTAYTQKIANAVSTFLNKYTNSGIEIDPFYEQKIVDAITQYWPFHQNLTYYLHGNRPAMPTFDTNNGTRINIVSTLDFFHATALSDYSLISGQNLDTAYYTLAGVDNIHDIINGWTKNAQDALATLNTLIGYIG